ncbi:MAG TPA: hypothetical protein VJC05_03295 [Candidatus Andersenbacteria bacterium]|nr:MAG: hypothetical protein A2854_05175 [Parcubacteria group bacterium RIFCSPHIGHO2_01_FULL_56_18]HLD26041.1 hypothetical protein [Candidatus Andersenbacteria bacterium]
MSLKISLSKADRERLEELCSRDAVDLLTTEEAIELSALQETLAKSVDPRLFKAFLESKDEDEQFFGSPEDRRDLHDAEVQAAEAETPISDIPGLTMRQREKFIEQEEKE